MATGPTTPVPTHWLRQNHVTRLPRRWIVLDSEAFRNPTATSETQRFRLAVASFDHVDRKGDKEQPTEWVTFRQAADVWQQFDKWTAAGRRTVVVAHNMGYDLRVCQAFTHLPTLGYDLVSIRLDGGQAWCQWRRGERTLVCVDSASWFGGSLAQLADGTDLAKEYLPRDDAPDEEWERRCRTDVEILRQAWLTTMRWIEEADQGNWKPTGAGQAWAAFRHRHMTHKLLHHGVDLVAAAEREAAWTGRCEAWRWGVLPKGRWYEYDFRSAYAQVAAEVDVPTRLLGRIYPSEASRWLTGRRERAALLRVEVDTPAPVAPCRGPHGVLWPIGRFETTLWDVEARAVLDAGGTLKHRGGWQYRTEPALRQWATWVLGVLDGTGEQVPAPVRAVVKGWSRSLVGRFGSRWASWEPWGEAHGPDVVLSTVLDGDSGATRRLLTLGDRCMIEGEPADAPDSVVSVMSYIMAVSRIRLQAAMVAAGLDHVAYVDTDGLLVDAEGRDRLEAAAVPGLRLKTAWRHVEVLGPRQLVLDGQLRAAGIPRKAERTGPTTWSAQVWQSLAGSLQAGDPGQVVLTDRSYNLRGIDHRRLHLAGGLTAPITLPAA